MYLRGVPIHTATGVADRVYIASVFLKTGFVFIFLFIFTHMTLFFRIRTVQMRYIAVCNLAIFGRNLAMPYASSNTIAYI